MSRLTVSTLRETIKTATRQKHLCLPGESFRLGGVQISIENENSTIDLDQFDDRYSIRVFDKELLKSVSLDFWEDSEVCVFVHFYKMKRTWAFWRKPQLCGIKSRLAYVDIEDEDNNEDIKFVWDRIPEFLINLR